MRYLLTLLLITLFFEAQAAPTEGPRHYEQPFHGNDSDATRRELADLHGLPPSTTWEEIAAEVFRKVQALEVRLPPSASWADISAEQIRVHVLRTFFGITARNPRWEMADGPSFRARRSELARRAGVPPGESTRYIAVEQYRQELAQTYNLPRTATWHDIRSHELEQFREFATTELRLPESASWEAILLAIEASRRTPPGRR